MSLENKSWDEDLVNNHPYVTSGLIMGCLFAAACFVGYGLISLGDSINPKKYYVKNEYNQLQEELKELQLREREIKRILDEYKK